jgi:basic amino acid/polyamine antiporter, APA family
MNDSGKISISTAILMNLNVMIGVGAFFGPKVMAQKAGYSSFLAWPLLAVIFLPIVFSISTISKIFPGAGSFYSYSKKTLNQTAGFISGWAFFIGYVGVAALQITCLRENILEQVSISPAIFNFSAIIVLCVLLSTSMKTVCIIQNLGGVLKLLPFIFVLSVFAFYINPSLVISGQELLKLHLVAPVALFGFWGFESCCTISHLIKGKPGSASKAVMAAFFIAVIIYTVFHFGLLHIMGVQNLVGKGTDSFPLFLGLKSGMLTGFLQILIPAAIVTAYISAIFSVSIASSSTLHSMAEENLFPASKIIAFLSKQNRPIAAICSVGLLIFAIISSTSNISVLIAISNLGIMIAFLFTLVCLLKIHSKSRNVIQLAITGLAFLSSIVIVCLIWLSIGESNYIRVISCLPLIAWIVVGALIFKAYKKV